MCGIAGMIGVNWSPQKFEILFDAIRHRGPDASGVYASKGLMLGMNRLQLRGAEADLPLCDDDVIAAFNGQIYGLYNSPDIYHSLAEGIGNELSAVRSQNSEIDGMYACSIITLEESNLFLTTDRQFIKPLFYRKEGEGLAFCSEFAPLLQVSSSNKIHNEALVELFAYGWYLSDCSYISQISTLCKNDLSVQGYTIRTQPKLQASPQFVVSDQVTELRLAIRESTLRCMQGTGPFGLAISGGLDSSILAWELNAAGVEGLTTLSVCMDDGEGINSLKELGLPPGGAWESWQHYSITIKDDYDFLSAFVNSTMQFGQPTTMSSLPLYWRLAELAAEAGVRVLLTGEGVDEFFCGYESYAKIKGLHKSLDYYRHPQRERLVRTLFGTEAFQDVKQRFNEQYINYTDFRQIERELRLVRLLIRTDVCLMSHSIEGRVPFLHNRIPDIALTIPSEVLTEGLGKTVLRQAYSNDLPQITSRPKMRFKSSDQLLKRNLANPIISSRILDSVASVFGFDEIQKCLNLLGTDSGFDHDICCLLMSLTFLIEQGYIMR